MQGNKLSRKRCRTDSSNKMRGLRLKRSLIGKRQKTGTHRGLERSEIEFSAISRSKEVAYSFRLLKRGPMISKWLTWQKGTRLRLRIELKWSKNVPIVLKKRSKC